MLDFIERVQDQLGADEECAFTATRSLLELVRDHCDGSDTRLVFAEVPGASSLLQARSSVQPAVGNTLGGGFQAVVVGNRIEALAKTCITSELDRCGMAEAQQAQFTKMFFDHLKRYVEDDVVARLLVKVPGLGGLITTAS